MSGTTDAVVELSGVTRTFGQVTAVADLGFSVGGGTVLGLLGHNGAGKTTTLRLINGVLRPSAGTVHVFGMDPVGHGAQVRRRTGVMLARPPVDRRLTGRENLAFMARLYGLDRNDARARIDELSVSFHVDDRLDDTVADYSDGMVQRLALARMLLADPALLLLDEPTASLDPMAAHGVRQLILDLAGSRERTIILSTHDLIEAAQVCDRVAVLQRGSLVAIGSPAELAGRVSARGLRLEVDDSAHEAVAAISIDLGYVMEPLDSGVVRLHGVAYDGIPDLVRTLIGEDIDVFGVTMDQPTLTDFYLALHGGGTEASHAS